MNKQALIQRWEKLSEKVEALTLRERGILLGTIIVGVVFIWGQFIYAPLQDRHKIASKNLISLTQQQTTFAEQQLILEQQLKDDPNRELRAQRAELGVQLAKVKSEIERQLSGLIAPEEMADVLRSMLQQQEKLKLVSLKNMPVVPFNPQSTADEDDAKEGDAGLYRHSMELVMDGQYFDVLEYIKRIESLKGFSWDTLSYEVIDYPKARVTIKISTLSLEEDWIGV